MRNKFIKASKEELVKIKRVLFKTGHIFEYQICNMFESKGWLVIPNKFYLDMDENKGREIDLVAYKIDEVKNNVAVATVVVIEAKQSFKNKWVFFTKGEYAGSVNQEKKPLFFYNEIDEVGDAIKEKGFFDRLKSEDLKMIYDFPRKAYCYSEVASEKNFKGEPYFKAINPSDIYGAIFPVIKALTSELMFYKKRKIAIQEKRLYSIYPLVVFNGSMFEAQIETEANLELTEEEEFQFITRYRSGAYDDFYSVNIIKWRMLEKYIDFYTRAHNKILDEVKNEVADFYTDIDTSSFEKIWDRVFDQFEGSNYFSGFTPKNFFPRYYSKRRNLLEILVTDQRLFDMLSGQSPYDYKGKIEKILVKIFDRKIVVDFTNIPLK